MKHDWLQKTACMFALGLALVWSAGCAAGAKARSPQGPQHVAQPPFTEMDARHLPMFRDGGPAMGWADLLDDAARADVIILGEQHDDGIGHAVQLAVVQDVFTRWPRSALSMEMLERDEQIIVDDFLDRIIDARTLARLTHSENWAGEGSWERWYQPMIDVAKHSGGRVIAANAPRRYVRLARLEGYERLWKLPRERRQLFALPRPLRDDGYRQRFFDLMKDTHHPSQEGPRSNESPQHAAFRSQLLWDSTMAESIVRARRSGAQRVVHLVGQFHSDFNGGLVQQIRARSPRLRILTISMQRADSLELRPEDAGRAHIIIYTGAPPAKEETEAEPAETAEPEDGGAADEQDRMSPGSIE